MHRFLRCVYFEAPTEIVRTQVVARGAVGAAQSVAAGRLLGYRVVRRRHVARADGGGGAWVATRKTRQCAMTLYYCITFNQCV